MFQALPAPLQMDPHLLSGSADQEGKGSGCQASCSAAGLLSGLRHFPISKTVSLSPGWGRWVLEALFLLETRLGESSRKTKGLLDGL